MKLLGRIYIKDFMSFNSFKNSSIKIPNKKNHEIHISNTDFPPDALGIQSALCYCATHSIPLSGGKIVAYVFTPIVESNAAQLLDNIDDDTRTKIQLAALVSSCPEIGVSLIEAVSATRLFRVNYPTFRPAILSADEVRLALAQKDLQGYSDAWNFARTNPKGADAWELLVGLSEDKKWVKTNKELLEKMSNIDVVEQNFVNLFYTTFRPEIFNPLPPTWINGIYFNKFGFPDFTVHAPHLPDGSRNLFKNTDHPDGYFDGSSSDMVAANNWALNKFIISKRV